MPYVRKLDTPLQRCLAAMGMTQSELARLTGLPIPTISRLCTGKFAPSRALAARVLDAIHPSREVFNELWLLYPERYAAWNPPGFTAQAHHRPPVPAGAAAVEPVPVE